MKTLAVIQALGLAFAVGAAAAPAPDTSTASLTTRDPPLRGGFVDHCDFYQVTNHGEAYGHLQAMCNFEPGNPQTEVASTLDLGLCLGNYNDHLDWGYMYVFPCLSLSFSFAFSVSVSSRTNYPGAAPLPPARAAPAGTSRPATSTAPAAASI